MHSSFVVVFCVIAYEACLKTYRCGRRMVSITSTDFERVDGRAAVKRLTADSLSFSAITTDM